MGGAQAAGVLTHVKQTQAAKAGKPMGDDEFAESTRRLTEQFDAEAHPMYATARLWDDGIIEPEQTRSVVAMGLAAAANAPVPASEHGVFRM